MLKLALISVIIIGVCIVFLCTGIILKKNGSFPKTHISQNKELRKRGITCVQSLDYEQRHKNKSIKHNSERKQ